MSKKREADASMRGYVYQFHQSIIEILSANAGQKIQIEGIEDIDIIHSEETKSIQCKYLQAQTYSLSKVRNAICEMLLHFSKNKISQSYFLFAHFKDQEEATKTISLTELKNMLVFMQNGKKIDFCKKHKIKDSHIKNFLKKFKFTFGPNLVVQETNVISAIKAHFKCSNEMAENYYYPKAFSQIMLMASKKNKSQRTTGKDDFSGQIENTTYLFNDLYLKHRGIIQYIKEISYSLNAKKIFSRSNKILLIIQEDSKKEYTSKYIANIANEIIKKFYTFWDAKPWTICISESSDKFIDDVKSELNIQNIEFNDGRENYGFNKLIFKQEPMIYRSRNGKGNNIERSSFQIRLISLSTLLSSKQEIPKHDVVIKLGDPSIPKKTFSKEIQIYNLTGINAGEFRDILSGV